MNPNWLLVPVFLMCVVGAWASYIDWARQSSWYVPLMAVLGAACAVCFGVAASRLDDKAKIYVFSLCYDILMLFAYYALPLLIFGAQVKRGVLIGACFVVIGILIVKLSD